MTVIFFSFALGPHPQRLPRLASLGALDRGNLLDPGV
jgi:hypothetical protein